MLHLFQLNEEDCLQSDPFSELVSEGDPFAEIKSNIIEEAYTLEENTTVSDTEEANSLLSLQLKSVGILKSSLFLHMNIYC